MNDELGNKQGGGTRWIGTYYPEAESRSRNKKGEPMTGPPFLIVFSETDLGPVTV